MAQRGRPKKEKSPEELAKLANKTPGKRGRPSKEKGATQPDPTVIVETKQVPLEELKSILNEIKQEETKTVEQANTAGVSPVKVNVLYNHTIRKN